MTRDTILSRLNTIEPYRCLRMELRECSNDLASIWIPLGGNRNDKGTMFAGSICSALVLAGWSVAWLAFGADLSGADVVASDSRNRYLAPVASNSVAQASLAGEIYTTRSGNRAVSVKVVLTDSEGAVCASLSATYVALRC